MILDVKVKPRAREEKVVPSQEGPWLVHVREAPEKGRANESLRRVIAGRFQVNLSRVKIVQGETSRYKRVQIEVL